MLTTLIKKEILESIQTFRFVIATLLCVVLIPLGTYVNMKEYGQRSADYQESVKLYREHARGNISRDFQAEAYRPPSVLSVFAVGLEHFIPDKFVTTSSGEIQMSSEGSIDNPESLFFSNVDLLFNVSFVISLLCFIFAFNIITGEKEEGTLRLTMSNPVSRWHVLTAKIVSTYIVLLLPFLISIFISLIVLSLSGTVPIISSGILGPLIIILVITFLFILLYLTLGVFVSTFTHRSSTALVSLLFLWTLLTLAVPKICPMVAEIIDPIKSRQVNDLQKRLARQSLEHELDRNRRELYDRLSGEFGLPDGLTSSAPSTDAEKKFKAMYDEEAGALENEYQQKIGNEISKFDHAYTQQRRGQSAIAMNLSRISPFSCYSFIVGEIASTGIGEIENFSENARRFQEEVKTTIYDKFRLNVYGGAGRGAMMTEVYAPGFNPRKTDVPELKYHHRSLGEAIQGSAVDIVLLMLFTVVFLGLSYYRFNHYDVR